MKKIFLLRYFMSKNLVQTLIKDLGTVVSNLETAFSSHIVHATTCLFDTFSLMHSKNKYRTKMIKKQWLLFYKNITQLSTRM